MATHSSTLAWKIPWMEEPGRLQSMGPLRVGHDWATSLWLFTFIHWRRKWQPTPVFLPRESQGWGSLVAAVYGFAQSWTRLKWLSSSNKKKIRVYLILCLDFVTCFILVPENHVFTESSSRTSYCFFGSKVSPSILIIIVVNKNTLILSLAWCSFSFTTQTMVQQTAHCQALVLPLLFGSPEFTTQISAPG